MTTNYYNYSLVITIFLSKFKMPGSLSNATQDIFFSKTLLLPKLCIFELLNSTLICVEYVLFGKHISLELLSVSATVYGPNIINNSFFTSYHFFN